MPACAPREVSGLPAVLGEVPDSRRRRGCVSGGGAGPGRPREGTHPGRSAAGPGPARERAWLARTEITGQQVPPAFPGGRRLDYPILTAATGSTRCCASWTTPTRPSPGCSEEATRAADRPTTRRWIGGGLIGRARASTPPDPSRAPPPGRLPADSGSPDAVLLVFAAQELRDASNAAPCSGRSIVSFDLERSLLLVKRCRDLANISMYGPGAWHFYPAGSGFGSRARLASTWPPRRP